MLRISNKCTVQTDYFKFFTVYVPVRTRMDPGMIFIIPGFLSRLQGRFDSDSTNSDLKSGPTTVCAVAQTMSSTSSSSSGRSISGNSAIGRDWKCGHPDGFITSRSHLVEK